MPRERDCPEFDWVDSPFVQLCIDYGEKRLALIGCDALSLFHWHVEAIGHDLSPAVASRYFDHDRALDAFYRERERLLETRAPDANVEVIVKDGA